MLLEVTGGQAGAGLPVHLGLLLDTSESMRVRLVTEDQFIQLANMGRAREVITDGIPTWQIDTIPEELVRQLPRRIDFVRDSLLIVNEFLRPADLFSVVAFAGDATTLIPNTSGREKEKLLQTARQLEYLSLGDETRMDAGLRQILTQLRHEEKETYASHLLILTDGYTHNVRECHALAEEARAAGLAISTMGLGTEFNESLLIPMADLTGGRAYYIETPEQLPEAFRQELGTAMAARYGNLKLNIQVPTGVTIRRAHRLVPELGELAGEVEDNRIYHFSLGHYDQTAPTTLLLEMVIPGWAAGGYRLAHVRLGWDDRTNGVTHHEQAVDVPLQVNPNPTMLQNEKVMNLVEKVGAFKMGTTALAAAQTGTQKANTVRLRQAATRLLEIGENHLGNEMLRQADMLEKHGTLDPNAAKKLRYETRRLTRQLPPSS
jgi:Ca-activated chloride channel family protein